MIGVHSGISPHIMGLNDPDPRRAAQRLTYLAVAAALLLSVLFINPPSTTTFAYVLHKSGHAAVFASIALICLKLAHTPIDSSWWKPYLGAFLVVLVCGAGTELAQWGLSRNPSLVDVGRDALGGSASLAIALLIRRWSVMSVRARASAVLLATAATFAAAMPLVWCVAAYASRDSLFPTIWEYRSPLDMYFVSPWSRGASVVKLGREWAARPNERAVEVRLDAKSPSFGLFEPYPDWRAYGTLALDMTNPNPKPLELIVRFNSESPDHFDIRIELEPQMRSTLRLRLDDAISPSVVHLLNKGHVAGITIFSPRSMPRGKFYLNRVFLEAFGRHD